MSYFYTAEARNGLRGGTSGEDTQEEKLPPRKRHFFLVGKYVGDIILGQNFRPDLLEWILKSSHLLKEELRRISLKMH